MKYLIITTAFILLQLSAISQLPSKTLEVFLYVGDVLMDGTLLMIDSTYSDDVNLDDARKLTNFGENIAINRNGILLAIERRKTFADVPLTLFQLDTTREYTLKIKTVGITTYFIEDKQEHLLLRVVDSINYKFRGNGTNRFKMVNCFVLSIPAAPVKPIQPAQVKKYYIYNLAGQFIGVSQTKPVGWVMKIDETKYIKLN